MSVIDDIRLALRHLLKARGFAIAAIATLALGIGANTAMFTVIDSVLIRPLPYPQADRLMAVGEGSANGQINWTSWPNWRDLKRDSKTFEEIGGYVVDVAILQARPGAKTVLSPRLTCNMLHVLGIEPKLGRGFHDSDCAEGAPRTVLLSDAAWRNDFGADPDIVGTQVRIGDVPMTVVGVMPAGFAFPEQERADATKGIWLPSQPTSDMRGRGFDLYTLIGRLRAGDTEKQAQAELATIAANLRKQYPDEAKNLHFAMRPYRDTITGAVRPAFLALGAALGLVLLIACANVANLQLSRCLARQEQLALRAALGAPRSRLMRELLVEGGILSILGSLAGFAIATAILQGVRALPADLIPRADEIELRIGVIAALAALATIATLLSSLIPALFAMRTEPQLVLRGGARNMSRSSVRSRLAGWVVAGEVAIAMILLVACSLLFRTLYNLQHKPLGFDAENLVTFTATPPASSGYLSGQQAITPAMQSISTRIYQPILDRLRALPGVENAALTSSLPFDGVNMRTSFDLNGQKATDKQKQAWHAEIRVMSGNYMRVVHTPMVRGRAISDDDTAARPYVAVVNQEFAREFLNGSDPIGQRIELGGKDTGMLHPYTIIGVSADAVQKKVGATPLPELMLSYEQIPEKSIFYPILLASATKYVLRTDSHQDFGAMIHRVFQQMAPGFAIDDLQTMQKTVNASMFNQRLGFYLIGSFAGVAVLMVVIGLYGVLSQLVSQRRQEIGIRMAVGATSEAILALILRQGSVLICIGLVIGVVMALGASRLVASFLYGVSAADIASYVVAAAGLVVVALLAALIPARRAAAIEPLEALRME